MSSPSRWIFACVACLGSGCSPTPPEVQGTATQAGSSTSSGSIASSTTMVADDTGDTSVGTGMSQSGSSGLDTNPTSGPGSSSTGPLTATDSATTGSTTESGCMGPDDCPGALCFDGSCVTVSSCQDIEDLDGDLPSGVYPLDPDGAGDAPPYDAYCDLEYMGGGWTLVLKAHGDHDTFEWSSGLWLNEDTFQADSPDLNRVEAKLASYSLVPVTEILVAMEHPIGSDPDPLDFNRVIVPVAGASLYDLISPNNHVSTNIGRDAWKSLVDGSSLQVYCNREGLNVLSDDPAFVAQRIGIIGNEYDDCEYADSRIGVGGKSGAASGFCFITDEPHGNFAGCSPDNGVVNYVAFAAVFVR